VGERAAAAAPRSPHFHLEAAMIVAEQFVRRIERGLLLDWTVFSAMSMPDEGISIVVGEARSFFIPRRVLRLEIAHGNGRVTSMETVGAHVERAGGGAP
jgi:hypothetical protein